jgi:catechol 2,3-dioxygenase-like lactoylglutathione lyase family enzyme
MAYSLNHVHLKASDPKKTADWYVSAFGFKIINDNVRPVGDRFIRCETSNGIVVNISGARNDETLGPGDATAHHGLEHFGLDVDDIHSELERLQKLGIVLMEGPIEVPEGPYACLAFIKAPDDVRIELMESR